MDVMEKANRDQQQTNQDLLQTNRDQQRAIEGLLQTNRDQQQTNQDLYRRVNFLEVSNSV
jgi:hypothetical protein